MHCCHVSRTFLSKGLLCAAEKDADQCIALKPDFAKGYIRKAHVQFLTKDYEKALETYETGLKQDPDNQELHDGEALASFAIVCSVLLLCRLLTLGNQQQCTYAIATLWLVVLVCWISGGITSTTESLITQAFCAMLDASCSCIIHCLCKACLDARHQSAGVRKCQQALQRFLNGTATEEEIKERQAKAMNDPQIQNIMTDPVMQQVCSCPCCELWC